VVIIIAGAVALKLYFTSDRLKALIIPRIQESTHRTVEIKDISLALFPRLGISVEGLSISNPPGAKFQHDQFLSLDKLLIDVKILPLLAKHIEVNRLILDRPKIYLEKLENGAKNYSTGTAETHGTEGAGGSPASVGSSLLLTNFEINDGEIEYTDRKSNSHAVIFDYNQTAKAETRPADNSIRIELHSTIGRLSYGSLKMSYLTEIAVTANAQLTLDLQKYLVTLDDIDIRLKDLPLKITGTVSHLQTVPFLDMAITAPDARMGQLLSLVPPELLKAAKGLTSSGDVKFSLTVKGDMSETMNPGVRGTFAVTNGKIQYASLPKSITNVNVAGSFDKPAAPITATGIGSFSIDQFAASLGNNDITGKLHMANFDDPVLSASFSGTMNLAEVKDFYPLEQGTEVSGLLRANVSLQGKAKTPAGMNASGALEFQNVTVKTARSPRPLKNMVGTITFNNQLVESKQLAMNIGESDVTLSFVLKNYLALVMEDAAKAGKPGASITLSSKQLRTADLLSESTTQESPSKRPATKAGTQAGLLPGIDIDANVNIGKLVTDKFEFDNARGSISISGGTVTLKNFSVNAFQGTVLSKGALDLRDPGKRPFNLDLDIVGVDAHALLPKFTSVGNNLFGKFTMKTKLQGELDDTLGLNRQTLAGNGTVQISDGKVVGVALTSKIADITGLNELREVNFKNWSNSFTIANGRVNISDLRVNAGTTDILMNGSQGLDGSLDYSLVVKLPASASDRLNISGVAGELLQFFKDKDGRISLSFLATGTYSEPVLKLDTKSQEDLAKQALQKKGDEARKKLENDLKKKAEDALKNLFKHP
jgi:uncharacterized protein involved in outer membrane biogenesis